MEQARRSQASVKFKDLRKMVEAVGYVDRRQKGSHHVFMHTTRPELPLANLQAKGANAKPYQVRQLLRLIEEHKLEVP